MSPENFPYPDMPHPGAAARERLIASLKAQYEAGEYLPSGEAIGGKMINDAIEEARVQRQAEQFISDWRALDNLPHAYCYVHNYAYPARGACCYCVNGVPMAPGHTDDIRQMQRNAQREIDWQVRMQALNGTKKGLAEGEKPLRLGRLRGGWLRQRRLERARVQDSQAVLALVMFGTFAVLILLGFLMQFHASQTNALVESLVREGR